MRQKTDETTENWAEDLQDMSTTLKERYKPVEGGRNSLPMFREGQQE